MSHIQKLQLVNGRYVYTKPYNRVKLCKDCKHFNKNGMTCSLFSTLNLVNGSEEHIQADVARQDNSICGFGATSFEIKDSTDVKDLTVYNNIVPFVRRLSKS
jgi:hypothetical protein